MGLCDRSYMKEPPDWDAIARADALIEQGRVASLPSVEDAWVGTDGTLRVVFRLEASRDEREARKAMAHRVRPAPKGPVSSLWARAVPALSRLGEH